MVTTLVFSATSRVAVAPAPLLVMTGASFTSVTTMVAVAVEVLNAVLPPFTEASSWLPAAPVVWSQARNKKLLVSPSTALGTNRTRSVARNSKAVLSVTAVALCQVTPASSENCHDALPLGKSVMAMPCNAALSASV